jgi:hypothetical protein
MHQSTMPFKTLSWREEAKNWHSSGGVAPFRKRITIV